VMRVVVERGLRGKIETEIREGGIRQTISMPRIPPETQVASPIISSEGVSSH
jgi:hypothetical protein